MSLRGVLTALLSLPRPLCVRSLGLTWTPSVQVKEVENIITWTPSVQVSKYNIIKHMTNLEQIEKEVENIKQRNKRVEDDKAWEASYTRRALLMIFTYLAIGVYLRAVGISQPWLNAIVPTVAFWLSTLTLPFFKRLWLKYIHKK